MKRSIIIPVILTLVMASQGMGGQCKEIATVRDNALGLANTVLCEATDDGATAGTAEDIAAVSAAAGAAAVATVSAIVGGGIAAVVIAAPIAAATAVGGLVYWLVK